MRRPNIIFTMADDMGHGDLGCYGATMVSTPNTDRIATEGMHFTDAHAPSAVCTLSRYSVLTGRGAGAHGGSGLFMVDSPCHLSIPPD
jgi:arylsulfatase A-like enzyme